jgi:hypothetical protein
LEFPFSSRSILVVDAHHPNLNRHKKEATLPEKEIYEYHGHHIILIYHNVVLNQRTEGRAFLRRGKEKKPKIIERQPNK